MYKKKITILPQYKLEYVKFFVPKISIIYVTTSLPKYIPFCLAENKTKCWKETRINKTHSARYKGKVFVLIITN